MTQQVRVELQKQGFEDHRIHVERMLNMRFEGTDTALMVVPNEKDGDGEDFEAAFNRVYKTEFGFLLDTKSIIVDDIKVRNLTTEPNEPKHTKKYKNRSAELAKHSTRSVNPSTPN